MEYFTKKDLKFTWLVFVNKQANTFIIMIINVTQNSGNVYYYEYTFVHQFGLSLSFVLDQLW